MNNFKKKTTHNASYYRKDEARLPIPIIILQSGVLFLEKKMDFKWKELQ